jgi:hypothetical protein
MTAPGTSEFEQWWASLPDGWPASRPYHDLLEATWNASRDASTAWLREEVAELTAEVARLKAEADQKAASYNTILCPEWHSMQAMIDCRDEEPGTVLRETDGQRREYVLGDDHVWRQR